MLEMGLIVVDQVYSGVIYNNPVKKVTLKVIVIKSVIKVRLKTQGLTSYSLFYFRIKQPFYRNCSQKLTFYFSFCELAFEQFLHDANT